MKRTVYARDWKVNEETWTQYKEAAWRKHIFYFTAISIA